MFPFLAPFWNLPLWQRTAIWVVGFWLLFLPAWMNDPKNHNSPFSLLLVFGFIGVLGYLGKVGNEAQKVAQSQSAALVPLLQNHLAAIPAFPVGQWCHLPHANGGRAIAVDAAHSRLALLDYTRPARAADTPQISVRVLDARQLLRAELDEQTHEQTHVRETTKTRGQSKTSGASMVGRAVVGGALLGPAGMLLGGATAKQNHTGTNTTTGVHTAQSHVTRLDLKLTFDDPARPLERLSFITGELSAKDARYQSARQSAEHWLALCEILRHRAGAAPSPTAPPQIVPPVSLFAANPWGGTPSGSS